MTLWTKIRLALAGVALVVTVPFYLYVSHRSASNVVMFENSLEASGDLLVDGKSKGTLAPKQHVAVTLEPGSHALSFKGGKGVLDTGTLDIPKKGNFGYKALYNLGGKPGIAVVTKYYGKDPAFPDKIDPVPEGTRLVELPETVVVKAVDEPFPDSIRTTRNAMSPSVTRLCHVDAKAKSVGCPGW
jgi:hypothetical protein